MTEFAAAVAAHLKESPSNQRALADWCEAAVSTVGRWADGTVRPHPRMQAQVLAEIARR